MAYYPPVSFHFNVEFTKISGVSIKKHDHQFQSVSGLSVDMETEEIAEGGENRFKHKIPTRTKYPNLVLKRGMLIDSGIIDWVRKALENFEFSPANLNISLLNEKHEPLQTWNIVHAFPVKWSIGDFNAEQNNLVIETFELRYNYFKII
jgi:phage tail-like protein